MLFATDNDNALKTLELHRKNLLMKIAIQAMVRFIIHKM